MKLALKSLTIAVACASSLASASWADIIHVPADAPTIQDGLDLAQPGDTVLVADGLWTGPGNRDLIMPRFDMILESAGGPTACIISSQGTLQEPHRGLTVSGTRTRATIVRGFTFTGGETEVGAIDDRYNGAGVLIQDGSPTIANCHFLNNHCACWGGAICLSGAENTRITGCYFEGNESGDEGGAVFFWNQSQNGFIVIDNSVFIRNHAGNAGGAICAFGDAKLNHVTIVQNTASNRSGAIGVGVVEIKNSVVWGNFAPTAPGIDAWTPTITYSATQAAFTGAGNLQQNPLFRPDGWHLRQTISPCVDAGDPTRGAGQGAVDIDGQRRRSGLRVDMGAHETKIADRMAF